MPFLPQKKNALIPTDVKYIVKLAGDVAAVHSIMCGDIRKELEELSGNAKRMIRRLAVTPAQAGVQARCETLWIPAFAGMTQ